MQVKWNSISTQSFSFFQQKIISVKALDKKILVVALVALAALTIAFLRYLSRPAYSSDYQTLSKDILNPYSKKVATPEVVYEGQLNKKGELNGEGKKIYSNGTTLEGTFTNNELIQGKITQKGTVHEGQFVETALEGPGKITNSNGAISDGNFENGELSGQGKMVLKDGTVYVGLFKYNHLVSGTITHKDGTTLKGTFQNYQLEGPNGKYIYPNGMVEEGVFKKNKLDGKGTRTTVDGIVYDGQFQEGKLVEGTINFNNSEIHTGKFKSEKLHEEGTITFDNGTSHKGTFENGELVHGLVHLNAGYTMEGDFKYGKLHGKGMITHLNGSIWDGQFDSGALIKGKLKMQNGIIKEGVFHKDLLNGEGMITHTAKEIIKGLFVNDVLIQGTKTYDCLNSCTGSFINNKLNGKGEFINVLNKTVYTGIFKDHYLNGIGKKIVYQTEIADTSPTTTYEGNFLDDKLHGNDGTITHPDGSVSKGYFEKDFLHGQGTKTFSDGTIFEGKFIMNKLYEGKKTFANGEIHDGFFKVEIDDENNDLSGPGKKTLKNGTTYEGYFLHGQLNDPMNGKKIDQDGNTYEGPCMSDHFYGPGTLTLKDGTISKGNFVKDVLKGKVTVTDMNGNVKYLTIP